MTLIDHTKWDCEFCNRVSTATKLRWTTSSESTKKKRPTPTDAENWLLQNRGVDEDSTQHEGAGQAGRGQRHERGGRLGGRLGFHSAG